VIGFWSLQYGEQSELSRYKFDWPFGRIELYEDSLLLSVNRPLRALYNALGRRSRFPIPLAIRIEAIDSITFSRGPIGVARVSSKDPLFRLVRFGAPRSRFDLLLNELERLGVKVGS
jgi:hypothetical protein